MPELLSNLYLDEEDFAFLYTAAEDWGVEWAIPNRFLNSDKSTEVAPSWDWAKAYWVGPDRAELVIAQAFVKANRRTHAALWDTLAGVETSPGVFEGSYVILTDYGA